MNDRRKKIDLRIKENELEIDAILAMARLEIAEMNRDLSRDEKAVIDFHEKSVSKLSKLPEHENDRIVVPINIREHELVVLASDGLVFTLPKQLYEETAYFFDRIARL